MHADDKMDATRIEKQVRALKEYGDVPRHICTCEMNQMAVDGRIVGPMTLGGMDGRFTRMDIPHGPAFPTIMFRREILTCIGPMVEDPVAEMVNDQLWYIAALKARLNWVHLPEWLYDWRDGLNGHRYPGGHEKFCKIIKAYLTWKEQQCNQ